MTYLLRLWEHFVLNQLPPSQSAFPSAQPKLVKSGTKYLELCLLRRIIIVNLNQMAKLCPVWANNPVKYFIEPSYRMSYTAWADYSPKYTHFGILWRWTVAILELSWCRSCRQFASFEKRLATHNNAKRLHFTTFVIRMEACPCV